MLADGSMLACYIRQLDRIVLAEAEATSANARKGSLTARVAAIVGDGTTTRIPDLQRALDANPRALGAVLRELGFRRSRMWSGDDYAVTFWRRPPSA
jgi:hypothetical protein